MAIIKSISLDDESYEIWKERFGSYSQEFSRWICDKLKEEDVQTMNPKEKREYVEKEKMELEKKSKYIKIIEEKLQEVEKEEEKTKEELEYKKSIKDEEIKKNFFNYAKDVYNLKDQEIEKEYEEFKEQDLGIIPYLNEKYGVEDEMP